MATAAVDSRARLVWRVGLALIAVFVTVTLIAANRISYDFWAPLVFVPVILFVTIPAIAREAARAGDRRLFLVMVVGLAVHLVGALVRYYVTFHIYGGNADATGYNSAGATIADMLKDGRLDDALAYAADYRASQTEFGFLGLTDTGLMRFATGILYLVSGASLLGGFMIHTWLAFWGSFFFYKAFRIAVPETPALGYALLLLFVPSLIFWPSSIGKEAWMLLLLGVASFGAAKIFARRTAPGLALVAVGIGPVLLLRPHIGLMFLLAGAFGYVLLRPPAGSGLKGTMLKWGPIVLVAVAVVAVIYRSGLLASIVDVRGGITQVLENIGARTAKGQSTFEPAVPHYPWDLPYTAWTVLFRPHLLEADGQLGLASATESAFLLALLVIRWRSILESLRSMRRRPYLGMGLAFLLIAVIAMSSLANFGLLARQRVQLLPFLLAMLCVPPRKDRDERVDVRT